VKLFVLLQFNKPNLPFFGLRLRHKLPNSPDDFGEGLIVDGWLAGDAVLGIGPKLATAKNA
jgi:hypothetical protein